MANLANEGIMFQVRALRDLTVTSLEVYGRGNITGVHGFQVYTRLGDFTGHISSQNGWSLYHDNPSVELKGNKILASLGNFGTGMFIPEWTVVSFYIYIPSNNLLYARGFGKNLYSRNGDFEIYEGSGISGIFGKAITARVFAGMIKCV